MSDGRPEKITERMGRLEWITYLDGLPDAFWADIVRPINQRADDRWLQPMCGGKMRSNIEDCVEQAKVVQLYAAIESKLQEVAPMPNGWKIFAHDPIEKSQKPHILLSHGSGRLWR
jgi:hypothetical protein